MELLSTEVLIGAGEVTGGVHGANRLGAMRCSKPWCSGGLLDRRRQRSVPRPPTWKIPPPAGDSGGPERLREIGDRLGGLLQEQTGVVRTGSGLRQAERFARLGPIGAPHLWWETRHRLSVSRLILKAALRRSESLGGHFGSDNPESDDARWQGSLFVERENHSREPHFRFVPAQQLPA